MGAWGYEVLYNDDALDVMDDLATHTNEDWIKNNIHTILHRDIIFELLLAVEIVDISLNGIDKEILGGFYGYEDWFKNIEKIPMENFRDDAIRAIEYIQKEEEQDNPWGEDTQKDRKQLLKKIENRLKNIDRMTKPEMCYLNTQPIKHGIAVSVQKKSLTYLQKILEMMNQEPIAFEEYIPEIEHLIEELSQEDYKSNSEIWY